MCASPDAIQFIHVSIFHADASQGPGLQILHGPVFVRPGAMDANIPANTGILRNKPLLFALREFFIIRLGGIVNAEKTGPFLVRILTGDLVAPFRRAPVAFKHFVAQILAPKSAGPLYDPVDCIKKGDRVITLVDHQVQRARGQGFTTQQPSRQQAQQHSKSSTHTYSHFPPERKRAGTIIRHQTRHHELGFL